jgi:hypothetical protein
VEFKKRHIDAVSSYRHVQVIDGFSIAIDPITDANEVAALFGTNLLEKHLIPVLVVASNQHSARSFVLAPERFTLLNGKQQLHEKSEAASTGGAEAAGWASAALGLGPALLVMPFIVSEVDRAQAINQNLRHQQLLQKTLSPGADTHGYVYFQMPQEKQRESDWTLILKLQTLPDGEERDVVFSFNW